MTVLGFLMPIAMMIGTLIAIVSFVYFGPKIAIASVIAAAAVFMVALGIYEHRFRSKMVKHYGEDGHSKKKKRGVM